MAKFTMHSIEFNFLDTADNVIGPIYLGAVTSSDISLNTETRGDDGGGIYDLIRCIVSQFPELTFSTKSIQTILAITGLNGICFHSASPQPGIQVYGQVVQDCKDAPSVDANVVFTIPAGLLSCNSLSVDRSGDAVVSFTIDALTDGNAPITAAFQAVVLPTNPVAEKYAMGVSRVGAVAIGEPTNLSLDFGIQKDEKLPRLGNVWPETAAVRKVQPVFSITGKDVRMFDPLTGIPLLGKVTPHSTSKVQFKKRSGVNAFVDDATLEHFYFTINGTAFVDNPFSTSGDSVAEFKASIQATYDGSNTPVVFGFNKAYSQTGI